MRVVKITFPEGFFMRVIVVFCLAYIVYLTERSMTINATVGSAVDNIYNGAVAFFGMELALTMIKTITALVKNGRKKNRKKKEEVEE